VDRAGRRGGRICGRVRRRVAGVLGRLMRRRGTAGEHDDGGGDQDAVHGEPPGAHQRLFVTCSSIRSLVEIAREAISYARCVSIMLTSSSTTFTFDVSSAPCTSRPRPFRPGVPGCGGPLATVSRYRFSPRGCRPAGFTKSTICSEPTWTESDCPASATETTPSLPIVTLCVPGGIVIAGSSV